MNNVRHQEYLLKALALAYKRRGFCAPNPSVGAIVLREGKIIGSGFHWGAGFPHAEVMALEKIAPSLSPTVLYVTLEPCCHFGKTPPCTELIKAKKIHTVYYGFRDPNPIAAKGEKILIDAGINCQRIEVAEINQFYASYFFWTKTKNPFVTAKIAISQDGKYCGPHGKPLTITGKTVEKHTHEKRCQSDALLTSINTIINDNPQMNVRLNNKVFKKPLYVLDSELRLPLNAKIFETAEKINLFYDAESKIAQNRLKSLFARGVNCIPIVKNENSQLDLFSVMNKIGEQGIHDLWVEVGKKVFWSLWLQKLINRALIYQAKICFDAGKSFFDFDLDLDKMTIDASRSFMKGADKVWQIDLKP